MLQACVKVCKLFSHKLVACTSPAARFDDDITMAALVSVYDPIGRSQTQTTVPHDWVRNTGRMLYKFTSMAKILLVAVELAVMGASACRQ